MFTSVKTRSASTYKRVGLETSVDSADAHHLIQLLFDALQQSLNSAKVALGQRDIGAKGLAIGKAVRILEEGLKSALNQKEGGAIAANLAALYDYCCQRLTQANLNNDVGLVQEVQGLIQTVSEGWAQMGQLRSETVLANQRGG